MKKLIIVPRVCTLSLLRVCWCVFGSMSLLFDSMCMHLPFIPWSICGSAFEPGASVLPYYCTSTCARSGCTRRARCVDSKPKNEKIVCVSFKPPGIFSNRVGRVSSSEKRAGFWRYDPSGKSSQALCTSKAILDFHLLEITTFLGLLNCNRQN